MSTTLIGTAYRIDDIAYGAGDTIPAGTTLTAVTFQSVDPDANDFQVTPPSVIFEGTPNETVLFEAEEITFLVDGEVIATESPTYEFVSLETNVGTVFGITFSAGGDTYFIPRNDFPADGLTEVTADSQIRANDVSFDQLEFGLLPPGATSFEGLVFGPGAIDAPGLGLTRTVIDTDDTPFNPDASTEINPFNAEVLVRVTFSDGSTISGVEAYQSGSVEFVNNQTVDTRAYALDVAAVEASGHTLDDVVSADFQRETSHDLSYDDIGFEAVDTAPGGEVTPPDPVETPNVIEGTDGDDTLTGTDGADVLIGGAGNDRLTGGAGPDTFVFGADSGDGTRDRDIIFDFDASEDIIVLEQGVELLRSVQNGNNLVLIFDDPERDRIVLRETDADALDSIVTVTDDFLV